VNGLVVEGGKCERKEGKGLRVGCCCVSASASPSLFFRLRSPLYRVDSFSPLFGMASLYSVSFSFLPFDPSDGFGLVFSNSLNYSKRGF
jgi:hypothetical protein